MLARFLAAVAAMVVVVAASNILVLFPLQVQLGYGVGLRNLHQSNSAQVYDIGHHNFNQDAAHNRVAQLTAAYFFEL